MGNTLSSRGQEEGSRGAPGSRPDGVDRNDAEDETADHRLDTFSWPVVTSDPHRVDGDLIT